MKITTPTCLQEQIIELRGTLSFHQSQNSSKILSLSTMPDQNIPFLLSLPRENSRWRLSFIHSFVSNSHLYQHVLLFTKFITCDQASLSFFREKSRFWTSNRQTVKCLYQAYLPTAKKKNRYAWSQVTKFSEDSSIGFRDLKSHFLTAPAIFQRKAAIYTIALFSQLKHAWVSIVLVAED